MKSEQKTLYLLIDSGTAIRNILRTGVFDTLRNDPRLRIVIVAPMADAAFEQEFAGERIHLHPLVTCRPNPLQLVIRTLKRDLWAFQTRGATYYPKRAGRIGFKARIVLLKAMAALFFDGDRDRLLKRLIRGEAGLFHKRHHPLLDPYPPDLIFCVTLYAKDPCLEFIAVKRGIPLLCMVHSWDNLTSKGPLPFVPDAFIVWNDQMKQELIRHHGIPAENITLSGIPQTDLYWQRERFQPEAVFFRQNTLDPDKKLITYTTGPPGLVPMDVDAVRALRDIIRDGRTGIPCQLLVRLHPKDDPQRFAPLVKEGGFTLQLPGRRGDTNDQWNPTANDMFQLAETLHYSDIVINIASTITIDAVAFDTPVINIAFDGETQRPYPQSCRRFYAFDHYRPIVVTGGVKVVESADSLVEAMRAYLADPTLDRDGRTRILREQYGIPDGKAGQRVAEHVLNTLFSDS